MLKKLAQKPKDGERTRKKESWKNLKEIRVSQKILTFLALLLLFLFFLNGILKSVNFGASLGKPIGQERKIITGAAKTSGSTFSIVFDSDPVLIFVLNNSEREASFVSIPKETYVELPQGRGELKLGSVTRFAGFSNQKDEGEFFKRTVQRLMFAPISRFALIKDSSRKSINEEKIRREFTKFRTIWGVIWFFKPASLSNVMITDITRIDLLKLWWQARSIRETDINLIDLEKGGVLEELVLEDGSQAKKVNEAKIRELALKIFVDGKIAEEGLKIQILNASGLGGLSERLASTVASLSGNVVKIDNYQSVLDSCLVILDPQSVKKKNQSYTAEVLSGMFNCTLVRGEESTLFDLTIVAGRNIAREF